MSKLPPQPPFSHRVVVGTIATLIGIYVVYDTSRDFEFVKFTPHSPEEVERRKRENIGLAIKHLETRTLDYTPEAKQRLKALLEKAPDYTKENSGDAEN